MKKRDMLRTLSIAFVFMLVSLSVPVNAFTDGNEVNAQNVCSNSSQPLVGSRTLTHLAFVVNDIEQAAEDFARLFGVEKPPWLNMSDMVTNSQYRGQPVGFNHKVAFINTPSMQIELVEPDSKDQSTFREFLRKNGEGIHHTGLIIDNMQEKTQIMKNNGFNVVQTGDITGNGGHFAFFDTKKAYKTMTELIQMNIVPPFPPNQPGDPPLLGTDKIARVGIVVKNLNTAKQAYCKLLGMKNAAIVQEEGAKKAIFQIPAADGSPAFELELIQPTSSSMWNQFLARKGENIHHLSFKVDHFNQTLQLLKNKGYRVIQQGKIKNKKYAYVDTTSTYKVVIKLVEK